MSHQPQETDPAFNTPNTPYAGARDVISHTALSAASLLHDEAIGLQQSEHHRLHLTAAGQDVAGAVPEPAYVGKGKGKKKVIHGKSPYQWKGSEDEEVPSWYRKLVRLKHYTSIPFQKIAKALEDAGGPESQTTSRLIQTHSGDKPGEGRLKAGVGRERREKGVERAAEARRPTTDASVNDHCHSGSSSTHIVVASDEPQTGSGGVDQAYTQNALFNSPVDLPADTLALPHAASSMFADPADAHGKRPHDDDGGRPDKRRRAASPRTSAAQIDESRFVQRLAELSGKPRSVIDHVVKRMSGSSVTSYISSTRSTTTRSRSRWSQRSSYQQGSHETPQNGPQQQTATLPEPSEHILLTADESSQADATTLRNLFALGGGWDGHEASLAEEIHRQLQHNSVKATVATDRGVTALHLAVKLGLLAICGILLWAGADCRAKTDRGEDAYSYAKKAQRAASNQGALYDRIIKCRQHVRFALDDARTRTSHPLAPASNITLRDLCNKLDPHDGRKAARDRTSRPIDHRASGSARPPAASLGTIVEAQASDMMQSAFSNSNNILNSQMQPLELHPSPSDSGFAGSPASRPGPSARQHQNSNHLMFAEGDNQPTRHASINPQVSLAPAPLTVVGHQQVGHTDHDTSSTNVGRAGVVSQISSHHDAASTHGFPLPENTSNLSYPGFQHPDNFVSPYEDMIGEDDELEGWKQPRRPADSYNGPDPHHITQDDIQDTRYLHEYTEPHVSRTPLQAVEPNSLPTVSWQQLYQQALATPSSLQREFGAMATQAYRTPDGLGLDGDGGWAFCDPLAQPQVSAFWDENVAPGPTTAGPAFEMTPQPAEDRARIHELISFYEDRTLWVSCKHKYPRNYDTTLCLAGCPALSRDGTSET